MLELGVFCCSNCPVLEGAWVGGAEDSEVLVSPSLRVPVWEPEAEQHTVAG